jgi:uncharacterized protein (TIGR04551 family)
MSRLAVLLVGWLCAGPSLAEPAPTAPSATTGPRFYNPFQDLTLSDAPPPDLYGFTSKVFALSGTFRVRGGVLSNLDLDHGLTPEGTPLWPAEGHGVAGDTVTSANVRLRLQPELRLGNEVRLVVQLDALDNVRFGSTPRGYPISSAVPQVSGSPSQEAPSAGRNAFADSLQVKKAWAEWLLPFGLLQVGRVGNSWGLGVMADAGDGPDDDVDDQVDRLGFVTTVFDHFVGLAYDVNATGPSTASSRDPAGQAWDLTDADDVSTLSLAVLRFHPPEVLRMKLRADRVVVNYGAYVTWRRQSEELPTYALLGLAGEVVTRDASYLGTDLWLRVSLQRLRFELEAAYVHGRVGNATLLPGVGLPATTMDQWGGVFQAEWQPGRTLPLALLAEVGVASGDPAWGFGVASPVTQARGQAGDLDAPQLALPGDARVDNFRFHPNYHVDEILWRRVVGTFTDGLFVKGRLRWQPWPALRVDLSEIYSRTWYAESAPGLAKPLGLETDLAITWFARAGVEATGVYALLVPLAGFRNVFTGVDPTPAHFAEVRLAFRF